MAQEYIYQAYEEIEGRVTKKLSKEFSRTQSRILGALSKLDEFLLKPQVRTCSVAVPGISRNNDSENWEPTGDCSLGDPCPKAVFSTHHSGNLNGSELEETHHNGLKTARYRTVNLWPNPYRNTKLQWRFAAPTPDWVWLVRLLRRRREHQSCLHHSFCHHGHKHPKNNKHIEQKRKDTI